MAGIKITLVEDVSSFLKGVSKSEDALDDLADSLDDVAADAQKSADKSEDAMGGLSDALGDVATDADKAGRKMGDGLSDGVDQGTDAATDSVDRLTRSFKDLADGVAKSSKDAGSELGSNVKAGSDEASAGLEDFKGEASGTATEVAASFDGSAESIAGGFQELAANAFAGFGPAGAVAGLAAAAGIGLVTKSMDEAKAKAAETAEKVAEIAGELIELGTADLGVEQVDAALNAMATTAEDGKIPLDELRKTADKAGIDWSDFARGVAGDNKAAQRSYAEVDAALAVLAQGYESTLDSQGNMTGETGRWLDANKAQQDGLKAAGKELLEQDATLAKAGKTAQNYAEATEVVTDKTARQTDAQKHQREAIQEASAELEAYREVLKGTADPVAVYEGVLAKKEEAERKTAEATAAATEDSSDSWEDYAADVTATTDDLIAEWNRQAAENAAFASNLAKIGAAGGQALADELRAKGPEVAAATAATIAESDPAKMQAAIDAHAAATGTAMGSAMAAGVESPTSKTAMKMAVENVAAGVPTVKLKFALDLDDAENAIRLWHPTVDGRLKFGQDVK